MALCKDQVNGMHPVEVRLTALGVTDALEGYTITVDVFCVMVEAERGVLVGSTIELELLEVVEVEVDSGVELDKGVLEVDDKDSGVDVEVTNTIDDEELEADREAEDEDEGVLDVEVPVLLVLVAVIVVDESGGDRSTGGVEELAMIRISQ